MDINFHDTQVYQIIDPDTGNFTRCVVLPLIEETDQSVSQSSSSDEVQVSKNPSTPTVMSPNPIFPEFEFSAFDQSANVSPTFSDTALSCSILP